MEIEIRSSVVYCFGVFEFDLARVELRRGGHYIRLQQQPLQLLGMLLQDAGKPVSREELRLKLWPAELVVDFDRNLNKAMNKLRHALGDTADRPRYIQTVHRVGYRFIAPVQKLGEVAAPPLTEIAETVLLRTDKAPLIADAVSELVHQWRPSAMLLQDAALRRWTSALVAVLVIGLAVRSWAPWPHRQPAHVVSTLPAVRLPSNEQNAVAVSLQGSPHAARLYAQAMDSLRRMDARTASQMLSQSIAIEPKRALPHVAMAKVWEQLGYDKRALEEAKIALALDDGSQRAEHLRVEGQYAVLSKNWKRAIEVYQALVEFFPDSVDDGLELAGAEIRVGNADAAFAMVKTLRLLPSPLGNDPRLDLAEAGVAESQGDYRRDLAAAKRGADKSEALGASLLLAQALADESWALSNLGLQEQALATAEHSLALFTQADDPRGVALDTGMIGIALLNQGDAAGAKQRFEQALHIHEALGGGLSVAGGYDNVGDAQMALGDLAGARVSYERSLHAYQQIGHEDGVALVKESLGTLWLAAGDVPQALRYLDEGLAAARQIGDRGKANDILSDMGDASRLRGDLDMSQRTQDEALAGFERLGDKAGAAKAHLALAKLSMDRGAGQRAAHEAQLASTEYDVEHDFSNEATADAVLARALLTRGYAAQAGKALVQAQRAAQHSDHVDTQLAVLLTAWLYKSHEQKSRQTIAERGEFAHIVLAARKHGFVTFVSEANRQATEILRQEASSRS